MKNLFHRADAANSLSQSESSDFSTSEAEVTPEGSIVLLDQNAEDKVSSQLQTMLSL
jgi:hypothetical protein